MLFLNLRFFIEAVDKHSLSVVLPNNKSPIDGPPFATLLMTAILFVAGKGGGNFKTIFGCFVFNDEGY